MIYIVKFDFSKLKGKIIEKYGSSSNFAKVLGISTVSMSNKMTSKHPFKPEEIMTIVDLLNIPEREIGSYFFTKRV